LDALQNELSSERATTAKLKAKVETQRVAMAKLEDLLEMQRATSVALEDDLEARRVATGKAQVDLEMHRLATEELRDTLEAQYAAAAELQNKLDMQRAAAESLKEDLEAHWLQRLEQQRESDALTIEARLRASFLQEELRLDEKLEAEQLRADGLECQLSRLRAQDLEDKSAAAAHHHESRPAEVERANIQLIRNLEAQLANERRDHADARQVEDHRLRQIQNVLTVGREVL